MKNRYRIERVNISDYPPILSTAMIVTMIDYWKTPEWLIGIISIFIILRWVIYIINSYHQTSVDIEDFIKDQHKKNNSKS